MSAGTSGERRGIGVSRRTLVIALAGVSLLVFVAGSFVFAYFFLFATSAAQVPTDGKIPIPVIDVPVVMPAPSKEAGTQPTAVPPIAPATARPTSILLLGIDQRDDERGAPTRSDTMIVVTVDETNKRAALISFPRDMWVQIPGFADNRINVANFLGDYTKYPGGGPALAKKTVEHNFGLKIDYAARIDFRGFERIVDTLGGVTVNVERAIRDDEYPTEDYGTMSIYIPAGVQHMNGKVALQYARSRHSENDFGRAKRQQRLLLAIRDRALQLDVIPKLPSLVGTLMDMVQTDIPPAEFLRLAAVAKDVDTSNVGMLVIDDKLAPPFKGDGGADLLMPDKPAIRRAIAALLADPVIQKEAARIEVQNGTTTPGLATRVAQSLIDQGFDVVEVSTADRTDYKTTQIVVPDDKKGTASLLASALKVTPQAVVSRPPATPTSRSNNAPDIRVILGQDVQ